MVYWYICLRYLHLYLEFYLSMFMLLDPILAFLFEYPQTNNSSVLEKVTEVVALAGMTSSSFFMMQYKSESLTSSHWSKSQQICQYNVKWQMVKWSWHLKETTRSKSDWLLPPQPVPTLSFWSLISGYLVQPLVPNPHSHRHAQWFCAAVEHLVEARTFCLDARLHHYFMNFQEFVSWHLIPSYSTAPLGRRTRWTAETE